MAATYVAHPEDHHSLVPKLRPGDILRFEAGLYSRSLKIHDLHGTSAQPIVIEGPGQNDEHAIYANLFFSGHAVEVPAIVIQPHNDIPKRARVFFNTVVHPW